MSEQKPNGADTDPFAGLSEAGTTSSRTPYADIEAAMQFGYGDGITLDPLPIKYKCRKPSSRTAEYIRCHPDRTLWQQTTVLEDQQGYDKAVYLVHPNARVALQRFLKHVLLVPAINTEDEVFLWYIPISDVSQGRRGRRSVELSARRVAESAISEWKAAHFQDGEWVGQTARGDLGEPNWPEDLTARHAASGLSAPGKGAGREHWRLGRAQASCHHARRASLPSAQRRRLSTSEKLMPATGAP